MGEEMQPLAGLGKLFVTTADDENLEHLQEIKMEDTKIRILNTENDNWKEDAGKGYYHTFTASIEPSKEVKALVKRLTRSRGRLPRKEKKRRKNRIMRNKYLLIQILSVAALGEFGSVATEVAEIMFPERMQASGQIILQDGEDKVFRALLLYIYKNCPRMLIREWKRNRHVFDELVQMAEGSKSKN